MAGRCAAGGCTPILTAVPFGVGVCLGIVFLVLFGLLLWNRPIQWFFRPDDYDGEEAKRRRTRSAPPAEPESPDTNTVPRRPRRSTRWRKQE